MLSSLSDYLRRLPNGKPTSRERFLLDAARDKHIVHIGFTDHPFLKERLGNGTWLHADLAKVTRRLVGLDIDREGVAWARGHGFEAHAVDATDADAIAALNLERADLVIAGEVIEHVDAPGPFLRAMHQLADRLIVTTPNAYQPLNVLAAGLGREVIHEDHVAWHSPSTLRRLHESADWQVEEIRYYHNPSYENEQRILGALANGVRRVARLRPYWCDGLIVMARRYYV